MNKGRRAAHVQLQCAIAGPILATCVPAAVNCLPIRVPPPGSAASVSGMHGMPLKSTTKHPHRSGRDSAGA